jgi:hypothetical protein
MRLSEVQSDDMQIDPPKEVFSDAEEKPKFAPDMAKIAAPVVGTLHFMH